MAWFNKRRETDNRDVSFPLALPLGVLPVSVTIYSHELPTGDAPIDCWTYVTHGLNAFNHREIVLTIKRESRESPAMYPQEPIEFVRAIVGWAQQGASVDAGDLTTFAPGDGPFGGHVLYMEPESLPGVDVPRGALAGIIVTEAERQTVEAYGAGRVKSRLAKHARYYPCPPWSDRIRLKQRTRIRPQTILAGVPCVTAPGTTVLYDEGNLRVYTSPEGRARLQRDLEPWKLDVPAALLTDAGPAAEGCLVWEPGLRTPAVVGRQCPISDHFAGCFLLIVPGQPQNARPVIVEDGFGLTLTNEAAAALRDALMNGSELRLDNSDGTSVFVERADAVEAVRAIDIVLLTPEHLLSERGMTAASLYRYIRTLAPLLKRAVDAGDLAAVFDVWIAVRTERRSRAWCTSPEVQRQLETVPPPALRSGAIGIELRTATRGPEGCAPPRLSPEWSAAAEAVAAQTGREWVTVDEILDQVWP